MIIDTHTHFWHVPENWAPEAEAEYRRLYGVRAKPSIEPHEYLQAVEPASRAIVVAFAAPASGINVPNEQIAALVRQAPDKLIGYASVDPNLPDCVRQLTHAVKHLGLRGVKLGPIYQHFNPVDRQHFELYRTIEELGVPVLWHQGTTWIQHSPLKYANPVLLDEVAQEFPRIKMVLAHLGHPWYQEAAAVLRRQPNLYADISGLAGRPWQFYQAMLSAIEYGVADKLIFGSDYPFYTIEETISKLKGLNSLVSGTGLPRIPDSLFDEIIERDSLGLLGLD